MADIRVVGSFFFPIKISSSFLLIPNSHFSKQFHWYFGTIKSKLKMGEYDTANVFPLQFSSIQWLHIFSIIFFPSLSISLTIVSFTIV